jgi:hypothetical protein
MTKSKVDLVKEKILLLKQSNLDVKDSLDFLHNIAENIPVVIVTCGPSLSQIPQEKLIALGSKCILIAVKQAHEYLNGVEIFHLINQFNLSKYKYLKPTYTISSLILDEVDRQIFSNVDLFLPHDNELFSSNYEARLNKRVAVTLDFDKYLLTNTVERPWGPGIVLELAIYLAIHLGTKNIFLVGYDLASPTAQIDRFTKFYELKQNKISTKVVRLKERLAKNISDITGISENRIRYELNLPYNSITSTIESDENELLINSSKELYLWLNNLGIRLDICSQKSYVSELIPRITIDKMSEILNLLAEIS